MGFTPDGFQWEVPARVISVLDGNHFIVEADLGFHVTVKTVLIAEGIKVAPLGTREGMDARKEAQRLLVGAVISLKPSEFTCHMGDPAVVAEIAYSPFHEPRSEQGSFAAAMLAAGVATISR